MATQTFKHVAIGSIVLVPRTSGRQLCCTVRAFKEASEAPKKVPTENRSDMAIRSGQVQGQPATLSGGYAVMEEKGKLTPWKHELPRELQPNEIDIEPTHNGVCHSDIHMRDNDWFISAYPFIPGHEVVGVVKAVGSQVADLRPGMRVGVGWMRDSCRRCPACLRGEENLCEPGYTGTIVGGNHGGFQAVLRVPADFAFAIPDGLDSAHAAPLLCAGITVFSPLRKYMTRPGMNVCVLGVGGLGHLGIQYASVMGGIVTGLDIAADKQQEAKSLGAEHFEVFDGQAPERLKGRFDIILNTASANIPTGPLLSMMKNDAVLVQIGIPGNKATITLPITDLVFGQKKVVGSIVGGRSDIDSMLRLSAAKNVKPMIEIMPSNKVNEAMDRMASGKARYRVVLEMNRDQDPALALQ